MLLNLTGEERYQAVVFSTSVMLSMLMSTTMEITIRIVTKDERYKEDLVGTVGDGIASRGDRVAGCQELKNIILQKCSKAGK